MKPTIKKIDGINYSSTVIETAQGKMTIPGITVRAMRKALESADPDAVVIFLGELLPEHKQADLLIGNIAGLAMTSAISKAVVMFGEEAIPRLAAWGAREL